MVSSDKRMQALRLASHKKVEEKLLPTNNGNSWKMPKDGATTEETRMAAKELDGKPMVECKPRPKDRLFHVSHCHSKGMQQLESTRMRSGDQKNVPMNSN